jgi:hypothetical protein
MAASVVVECPRHGGSFDCPAFCDVCGGEQEIPEREWFERYKPDTFECGDGYHECDDDGNHEHATYLMFYDVNDDALSDAAGRVWSLRDDVITAGRHWAAEWLFITELPTNN